MHEKLFSSKEILLIQVLGECSQLLTDAHERLGEDKFKQIAEFADFAHHRLIDDLSTKEEGK